MQQIAWNPPSTPANLANDHALNMFMLDVARQIYPADEVATRWGFGQVASMRSWLAAHPEVIRQIESIRAINQADESVLDRIAHKAAHSVESSIPAIHEVVSNPNTPAREKIAGAALLGKWAGSDAHAQPRQAGDVGGGTRASIVIQFTGMPAQTISPTVVTVEAEAVSPSTSPSIDGLLRVDDGAGEENSEFEEDA